MVTALIAILLILVGSLLAFVLWVCRLLRQVYVLNNGSHMNCIAEVKEAVDATWSAALLRNLADAYDSVENQTVLEKMRWERMNDNDVRVTIPAQWLRMQADKIDPLSTETSRARAGE